MPRLPTGVPGFDAMVQGGLPIGSSVVLQGPPGQEKLRFALTFLAEGLKSGGSGLVVTASQSPDAVLAELRDLGVNMDSVTNENRLRVVDWYSWSEETVHDIEEQGIVIRSSIDLTNLGVALSRAIASLTGGGSRRAVIELLSPATSSYEVTQVYAFAQSAKRKFDRHEFTSLVLVEKEMHSSPQLTTLLQPFDGVIEIERTRSGDRIVRKIGVLHLKDTAPDPTFRVLEMTESGMRVVPEASKTSAPTSSARGGVLESQDELAQRLRLILQIATERLKLNSGDADALFAMAAAQATLDDAKGGLQTLDRLAALDSAYPGLWVLKTKLHAKLGQGELARESRVRAQQTEPEAAEAIDATVPCPMCEAPVAIDATTCANCGVKFTLSRTLEDELDDLGKAAIQEMVEEDLGGTKEPEKPIEKPADRPSKPKPERAVPPPAKPTEKSPSKKGLTNGRTNGLGRTNGITNGLGRTNGLTNGLGGLRAAGFHASGRRGMARSTGWKLYLIPLVSVALLLVPLFFAPEYAAPSYPIQIDGRFADWNRVPHLAVGNAVVNPDIDIKQVAVKDNVEYLSFYMQVAGDVLAGGPAGVSVTNGYFAFIDTDRTAQTGYRVQGIGADRLIKVYTFGGNVVSATLFTYDSSHGTENWNGWTPIRSIAAAGAAKELEFQAPWSDLGPVRAPVEVAFASRSWDGQSDAGDVVGTSADPFVLVSQDTVAPAVVGNGTALAQIVLRGVDGDMTVTGLNETFNGTFASGSIASVSLVDETGNTLDTKPMFPRVHFTLASLTVGNNATRTLSLRTQIATQDATTVGAFIKDLDDVVVASGGVAFVAPVAGPANLGYIGTVPARPVVDGAFGEWQNITGDPIGDEQPGWNPDIDLTGYEFQGFANETYFMARVLGTSLNGTMVPALNPAYVPPSTGTGNGTVAPPPPPVNGTDTIRFFLDSDGNASTGYAVGGLGADYLVEISGKAGLIASSMAMRFSGSGLTAWNWTYLGPASAAKAGSHVEASFPGVRIANISRAFFQMTGWGGARDDGTTQPAFVRAYGLMYSAGGLDPTGIIDTSTSAPVNGPAERNVFFDGTNFWAFYYDGTTIMYEPSSNGLDWVNTKNTAFTTANIQKVSTWFYNAGGTKIVYIAGAIGSATAISVRRGTISGTTITWGTEAQITSFSGSSTTLIPVITRDANGFVWVGSNVEVNGGHWNFDAVQSTNVDDVSTWNLKTALINGNSIIAGIQGVLVPLGSGNIYAIWFDGGSGINGKLYSGSWGNPDSIAGNGGILDRGPSATVDGSFNIHLVYIDPSTGSVIYQQRTSSWQSATTLDSSSGNKYPTISRDTGTGDLYAFWISSTYQIKAQKFSGGAWSSLTLETNTKTKTSLTGLYNASSSSNVAWAWSQTASSGFDVKFSVLSTSLVSRTIDTSTDGTPGGGGYSHQRKIFYDGTRWWAFYYDGSNSVYTWSDNALTWENAVSQVFTSSGVNNPSVWFDSGANIVYAVGDDGVSDATVPVRRGTISGTTITWGTQAAITVTTVSFGSKVAFITKDSNGFLWVASNSQPSTGNYDVAVVKSTNADDVSAWGSLTTLLTSSIASVSVYPTILPLSSGNVYAFWYANGAIDGKVRAGGWGSLENIATTATGVYTKAPSGTVDASGNIDLVYSDSSGAIVHKQRTSSWGAADTVDSSTGNTQPTITRDSSTGNLYVFYVQSTNQIKGRKYSGGTWTDVTGLDVSTITKAGLTSPYSVSGGLIGFLWNQGDTSPYEIKIAVFLPEFEDIVIPLAGTLVLALVLGAWQRRRRGSCAQPGRLISPE